MDPASDRKKVLSSLAPIQGSDCLAVVSCQPQKIYLARHARTNTAERVKAINVTYGGAMIWMDDRREQACRGSLDVSTYCGHLQPVGNACKPSLLPRLQERAPYLRDTISTTR